MRVAVALIAVTICAACAPIVWVRAGATQQDFSTDSYECERDSRQSGYYGTGLYAVVNMVEFQQRCMVARGWMQQAKDVKAASYDPDLPISSPALEERLEAERLIPGTLNPRYSAPMD